MGKLNEVLGQYEDDFANGRKLSSNGEECKELFTEDWESLLEEDQDDLLTIEEAAALLGVSKQTLRNWEKEKKLIPSGRTAGNHRRYTQSQINTMRGKQMNTNDILLHGFQVAKLRDLVDRLLGNFEPDEMVNITVKQDHIERTVEITIDSANGMSCISKTFKMED
jgi:excisionase family DNA binding protein